MKPKEAGIAIKLSASEMQVYEAGKRAGIREVVEWIGGHKQSTCMDCLCAYDFRTEEWQAKLKEWGLGENTDL